MVTPFRLYAWGTGGNLPFPLSVPLQISRLFVNNIGMFEEAVPSRCRILSTTFEWVSGTWYVRTLPPKKLLFVFLLSAFVFPFKFRPQWGGWMPWCASRFYYAPSSLPRCRWGPSAGWSALIIKADFLCGFLRLVKRPSKPSIAAF